MKMKSKKAEEDLFGMKVFPTFAPTYTLFIYKWTLLNTYKQNNLMNKHFTHLMAALCWLLPLTAGAQGTQYATNGLSKNPDKFLGNITTGWNGMDVNGLTYYKLWNQVTPENSSKWASVEGTKGSYNWSCDTPFNYAKNHNFPYKFHALVWGSQYPDWFTSSMSITDRFNAMENWFDKVRGHYSALPMIDVVNEAVGMHQPGNPLMKESLGGGGKTGYDWLIKAFEMAYERFPNSILIYNDYNSIQNDVDNYLTLVQALRDAGAPIDAYGNQAHDVNNISSTNLRNVLNRQQNTLKMPMFITELDINIQNNTQQKTQYQNVLPVMWEADYCAGVTLWGYIYGSTWVDHSGLYNGSTPRPAMDYIKEYMATEKAKTAKSPYPGMKKRVGVYVRPKDYKVARGDVLPIKVRTHITTDAKKEKSDIAIEKVELYVGSLNTSTGTFTGNLVNTMTEEPYITEYAVPTTSTGIKTLKATVYTNDGNKYDRYARFEVLSSTVKREPFNEKPFELPGTINCAEYDKGASGVSYYNGVGRSATTATKNDGWMEYTVDVKEPGIYSFDAEVAAASKGGVFHLSEYGFDDLTYYSDFVEVPATGSNSTYQKLHGVLKKELTAGRHVICLNTDKGGFYIKSLTFQPYKKNTNVRVSVSSISSTSVTVGEKATINLTASVTNSTIANVKVYANDMLIGTLTEAPYTLEYVPEAFGDYTITAIATDADGKENKSTVTKKLKVKGLRSPYTGTPIALPGTVEAENFDKGGEEVTYHDSNTEGEGNGNSYRSDHGGVDIKSVSGVGHTIGYTHPGEWLEYTVDVKEAGTYEYDAYVSSGTTGSAFKMQLETNDVYKELSETINVPKTGDGSWNNYVPIHGRTLISLSEGQHILRINATGESGDIDKVVFNHIVVNNSLNLTVSSNPTAATVNEYVTLKANSTAANIQSVKFYVDNRFIGQATEAPFEVQYKPTAKGTYNVTAEAITTDGKISKVVKYSLKANNKRSPYRTTPIAIPGIIQAENFDKGGEGLSFHDANSDGEGDNQSYRSDAEGMDIVKGNNGAALGYTATNEWTEYTVNVKTAGKYSFKATVSSGVTNSGFSIGLVKNGSVTTIGRVSVPQTGNNSWDTYRVVSGDITRELEPGEQILRFTITGANCNIDKVELVCVEPNAITDLTNDQQSAPANGKKVYENGQLVIYLNGKRYNALGVELK